MLEKVAGCPFCEQNNGKSQGEILTERLIAIAPKIGERAIYLSTENFITTVDQHPLTPDPYFLIIPRQHFTSFAQMPVQMNEELREHIEYVQMCTREKYSEGKKMTMVVFEHGQNETGNAVKSVYHAHLHVLWMDTSALEILGKVYGEFRRLDVSWQSSQITCQMDYLANLANKKIAGDYLYFFTGDDASGEQVVVIDEGYDFRSQLFRVILAEAAGVPFVNWKTATPMELTAFGKRLEEALPPKLV